VNPRPDAPAAHRPVVLEYTLVAKFRSTDAEAREIKRICETAVAAFLLPSSREAASALFELGAAAVVAAAEANRG